MFLFVDIQVKWIRADNSSLPQQAYERSGTLYIDQVQPYAEGEYRCLGLNEQGQVLFQLNTYLKVLCEYIIIFFIGKITD